MKEKALEAFVELKDETNKIHDSYTLENWKNKATNIIIRIYGKDSTPESQIKDLKYTSYYNSGGNNAAMRKQQAFELIDGLIKEIERFGLPIIETVKDKSLSINITQTQNQETKISLSLIIESIQNELTGSQLKELQEIISNVELDKNKKRASVIERLKQFGTDVAANILANILTNPSLIG
jgi:hypothetical protein